MLTKISNFIRSDYPAFISLFLFIVLWGIFLLTLILGAMGLVITDRGGRAALSSSVMLFVNVIVSPILLTIFFVRLAHLLKIKKNGVEVTAEVSKVEPSGFGGFVHYQYEYGGIVYTKKIVVLGPDNLSCNRKGDKAVFVINSKDYSEGYLLERIKSKWMVK